VGLQQETVWTVPLYTDVRLVFYRRDLLEKAGIDEKNAFQTPKNFAKTIQGFEMWGKKVGGHMWRVTGDVFDSWVNV
jgi:ABC-type glycerol-3-phosphate transport system substrate-binding protein